MKALLIGYGKMGKYIDELAQEFGITVAAIIDRNEKSSDRLFPKLVPAQLSSIDVAIDFSSPENIVQRTTMLLDNHIPLVIGTTGWQKESPYLKQLTQQKGGKVIASANFSIGVYLFLEAAKRLVPLFETCTEYDIALSETHHQQKKDRPSGTALMLADVVLKNLSRKTAIAAPLEKDSLEPNILQIESLRVGSSPGEHTLQFDSIDDTITLNHRARSRQGFARGALKAARFIKQSEPGWYGLEDLVAMRRL